MVIINNKSILLMDVSLTRDIDVNHLISSHLDSRSPHVWQLIPIDIFFFGE